MLAKPSDPFGPDILKETVVVVGWFVVIVALDIWELLTFPPMPRSTIAPLPIVTGTVVTNGVGLGDGVFVGVGVRVGV